MTIPNLIHWLFLESPVTLQRIEKAQREAARNDLTWESVLAAMTDEQRYGVDHAQ